MKLHMINTNNTGGIPVRSDIPTETFVTPKAFVFFGSAIAAVICLFMNWLPLDLNLGYLELEDVLGTINVFTLFGAVSNLKEVLGMFGVLLPDGVTLGFVIIRISGLLLSACGIAVIVLYSYAAFHRLKGDDKCVRAGKLAALITCMTVFLFVLLVLICFMAMDIMEAFGQVVGKVLTGPCMFTLIAAIISGYCAVRDSRFKENVVIYHNGEIKIDDGPMWKCASCRRKNLSLLQKCYYCGKEK